ncbi:MAG: ROK family protein [Gemmatimonadales bacterium]
MPVIALDLGATKLAAARFTRDGHPAERHELLLQGRRGPAVGQLIIDTVRSQLATDVTAVGICVPGIYRAAAGSVWAPNIPGWDDYPLLAEVRTAVPKGVAVAIDSDRACSILGETWRGAAQGARDAIFVAIGTGIGAGVLVDGRVLRGHGDIAGAVGWFALDRPYRADYAGMGCFEYHASGAGIAQRGRRSTRDVFQAYDAGDAAARRVLDEAVEFWAMALANLVSVFNPERVIFGGGLFGPATRFLDRICAQAARWAQPIAIGQVTVTASALGADAALYGAARLALEST